MEVKMINNYYNILAESLTKKYTTSLNEAWGENIPDWMKSSLERGRILSDGNNKMEKSKIYQKALKATGYDDYAARQIARKEWEKAKGVSHSDFADYQNPRGSYMSDSEKSLFSQFKAHGIDLNSPNMKFIEGEPPKSKNDPRIQPPNIGIWYIPSQKGRAYDQVYAQGINDLEKPFDPAMSAGNYSNTPFKDFSVKKLAEISSKFCYIDGSTIEKRDYDTLKQTREENKAFTSAAMSTGQERLPNEARVWNRTDASGYMIIPSSQKYAHKLEEMKLKGWAKKLTDAENELNSLYSNYQQTISSMDMFDLDYDFRNATRTFMSDFVDALMHYKNALQEIDSIKSRHIVNSKEFLQALKDSSFTRELRIYKNYIDEAKNYFKDYMLSEIDI